MPKLSSIIFFVLFFIFSWRFSIRRYNSNAGAVIAIILLLFDLIMSSISKMLPDHMLTFNAPSYIKILLLIFIIAVIYSVFKRTALGARLISRESPHSDKLGSAQWASEEHAKQGGNLGNEGVSLGLFYSSPKVARHFRHKGHVLTVAPTRSGKGIGAIIPALLEYPGSVLCLDIKGENYAVTARRRRELGQAVYLVDPFGLTGGQTARFNWLDMIDPASPDCVADSATLADLVVVRSAENADPYWDDAASNLLQGLILYAATLPEDQRHMGTVREALTLPEIEFDGVLASMSESKAGFGVIARAANTFMAKAEKDRSGVLSAALRHTAWLDDPRIALALSASDFKLAELKAAPMTVYLVMPPDRLVPYRSFVRGFFGLALTGITRTQIQPQHKVLFMLDEFAQLGHMALIENAISLVSGYGAAFWLFVQDLSQLKGVYKKWQTFLANSARQFFGTTDYDTAKYISDSLGKQTIVYSTVSESRNIGYNAKGGSISTSQHIAARDLMTPDEVMRLSPEWPIVFVQGQPPHQLARLNYLFDPDYVGYFDKNPFYG
ncbi:type IV secretory system conjugative DNA transfer family protein [Desulfovibrio sp. UIB00]|uniref:type IV secretory system conjugative DNA transfer family protein n=1 Tax=Desulfovibrio sp. UIB00 TaxID=2804314 RepID=UPI001F0D981D|nr:type IV secretory system conjugative DNA transfer family protein [Desulfovibrio sp. UIB00]MCH5146355.1 type IV secretory system conjugative DNA transfer family protein [Desulfovibrio sp. UIB00]